MGRRTLLALGGSTVAASMAALGLLLAASPAGATSPVFPQAVLLPVVLVLLCINRVALACTLQPLAVTGACVMSAGQVCGIGLWLFVIWKPFLGLTLALVPKLLLYVCCLYQVPSEVAPLQVRSDLSSLTTGVRNGSSLLVTQFALPLLVSVCALSHH